VADPLHDRGRRHRRRADQMTIYCAINVDDGENNNLSALRV
jgi:hypothetical protein